MSILSNFGAAIWARRVTFLVWAVIIVAVSIIVSVNRANVAHTVAALSSSDQKTRDSEVLGLVNHGQLIDSLTATENPNQDATSDQNVQSAKIRENAADSVNRLSTAHKIADGPAMDTLFLLSKDSDSSVKDTAKDGLARLGAASDGNLRAIIDKLKDGDPDIRGAAVDALSRKTGDAFVIDPNKTVKLVDPLLLDPAAQDSAQSVMQNIGEPAVPLLTAHLSAPNTAFRQKVVSMLGQIASPQSVPDLNKAATGDQPSVRRLALVALANTVLTNYNAAQKAATDAAKAAADPKAKPEDVQKDKDAVAKADAAFALTRAAEPALISALRNPEDDSEARTQAALALGRLGSPAAVTVLVASLGDFDSRVALAAQQGAQSAGAPAVGPLLGALARGTETARASAAQALGGIGTPGAVAALQKALGSPATPLSVRHGAVVGLGQSGNPAVIPSLVAALADPDGTVQSAASDALLTPALETSAISPLIACFARPAPAPFNASETLSRMGGLAIPALEASVKTGGPQTQTWAAVTLGETDSKDPAVVAALAPLAQSGAPGVKYAASQAINRLSGT